MKYPKVEIFTENKGNFEAQYICFLAKGISTGTYQDGGFLILPSLTAGNPKTVHFPDFPYTKDFWRTINFNPNINLSTQFPDKALKEVSDFLKRNGNTEIQHECTQKQQEWQKIEADFFRTIENFLDLKKAISKVEKIKVLITPYGTRGSFNPPRVGNKFNLMVTSRSDMSVGNIASGILQNLYIIQTNIGGEIGSENYLKRMSAINFLFTNTVFSKFYPDFVDLTKPYTAVSPEIIKKSEKFLTKLGFPNKKILDSQNGQIYINGKSTKGTFTTHETRVLSRLISANGNTVTFDQVADSLWGEAADEKYSLESMAKIIEGLRRKIREAGIHKSMIQTLRGRGYFLYQ